MPAKFKRLDAIIKQIDQIAFGTFHKKAIAEVAETMYGLAEDDIAAARNPRGRAWRPLSKRTRNKGLPLRVAASSLHQSVSDQLAKIYANFAHARAHQKGAKKAKKDGRVVSAAEIKAMTKEERGGLDRTWKLPTRSFLPKGGRLPPRWREAINARMRVLFGQIWQS